MAKYKVNGQEFETSLSGLIIVSDTNEKTVFTLGPVDGKINTMNKYFAADPKWISAEEKKGILLYKKKRNKKDVGCLAYINWHDIHDRESIVTEIKLDAEDRAYLNGLLSQWFGKDDS